MATSSTPPFLRSNDAEPLVKSADGTPGSDPQRAGKRFPRWIVFAAIGILFVAGAAACVMFLRHRTREHNPKTTSASRPVTGDAKKTTTPAITIGLPLDPFVVNLADAGGHSYARIGLTLELSAPTAANGKSEKDGVATDTSGVRDLARDTIITVLNQEQSADLLAPGGKGHLKQAIRAAVSERDPKIQIADIYFTEFLIQQ